MASGDRRYANNKFTGVPAWVQTNGYTIDAKVLYQGEVYRAFRDVTANSVWKQRPTSASDDDDNYDWTLASSPKVTRFEVTDGSWTTTEGSTSMRVYCQAAGGGIPSRSNIFSTYTHVGGGGGGGAFVELFFPYRVTAPINVVVGLGVSALAGGDSRFGAYCDCSGGKAGTNTNYNINSGLQYANGTQAGGDGGNYTPTRGSRHDELLVKGVEGAAGGDGHYIIREAGSSGVIRMKSGQGGKAFLGGENTGTDDNDYWKVTYTQTTMNQPRNPDSLRGWGNGCTAGIAHKPNSSSNDMNAGIGQDGVIIVIEYFD